MENLEWRDRLLQELKKRNLPDGHTARLLEELTDHFIDIQQENLSMDALESVERKLGTPEFLAAAAENGYRKRTFAGRHPILVFALLPIPVALLMLVVTGLLIAYPFNWLTDFCRATLQMPLGNLSTTTVDAIALYSSLYVMRFVPLVVVSWTFIRVSRQANNPFWGLMACIVLSYFAFMFRAVVEPSLIGQNLGLRIGIGYEHGLHQWQNGLFQMLVPLGIGLFAWRKHEQWPDLSKRTLILVPLFPIVCAFPLQSGIGKLMAITAFSTLIATAIFGTIVCVLRDHFDSRLSRA